MVRGIRMRPRDQVPHLATLNGRARVRDTGGGSRASTANLDENDQDVTNR
jgi:hypothetical protein